MTKFKNLSQRTFVWARLSSIRRILCITRHCMSSHVPVCPCGLLWARWRTFGFGEMWGIRQFSFQEGLGWL